MKFTFTFFICYLFASTFAFPLFNGKEKKEKYFIQLKAPDSIEQLCSQDDNVKTIKHLRQEIKKRFSFGKFEGLAGEFSKEVIERISSNPLIEMITKDIPLSAVSIQENAPPHLARVSQEEQVDLDQEMNYFYSDQFQGKGVRVYIIDTGVYVEHPEFQGRAELGPNFSEDYQNMDYVGHGTHVAGIAGSKTYGVAKQISIHSVKVLDKDGQGSLSSVISGLEYAVNHMHENGNMPSIANLSLGAIKSSILDSAVRSAYQAGLVLVVAAGNNNMDACKTSPAGSPYAITVGAINDFNDNIAHFSNFGKCVDIFAGGVDVQSLNNFQHSTDTIQILSGTSMASPIVAGLSAILLNQGYAVDQILLEVQKLAVEGAIPKYSLVARGGSPNFIANNGFVETSEMYKMNNNTIITV